MDRRRADLVIKGDLEHQARRVEEARARSADMKEMLDEELMVLSAQRTSLSMRAQCLHLSCTRLRVRNGVS